MSLTIFPGSSTWSFLYYYLGNLVSTTRCSGYTDRRRFVIWTMHFLTLQLFFLAAVTRLYGYIAMNIVWIHFWDLFVAIYGKLILHELQLCQKDNCTLQLQRIGQNIALEYFTIFILPNLSRTGKKTKNIAQRTRFFKSLRQRYGQWAQRALLCKDIWNHGPWLMYSEVKILSNWTMYHVPSATILAVGTRFLSTMNQYFSTNFFLVESNRIHVSQCRPIIATLYKSFIS